MGLPPRQSRPSRDQRRAPLRRRPASDRRRVRAGGRGVGDCGARGCGVHARGGCPARRACADRGRRGGGALVGAPPAARGVGGVGHRAAGRPLRALLPRRRARLPARRLIRSAPAPLARRLGRGARLRARVEGDGDDAAAHPARDRRLPAPPARPRLARPREREAPALRPRRAGRPGRHLGGDARRRVDQLRDVRAPGAPRAHRVQLLVPRDQARLARGALAPLRDARAHRSPRPALPRPVRRRPRAHRRPPRPAPPRPRAASPRGRTPSWCSPP